MLFRFANAGIFAAIALLLVLPALRTSEKRRWALLLALVVAADSVVTSFGGHWQVTYFASIAGKNWNWGGKGLSFCLTLAIAVILIAARKFAARDFGLTLRQAPGTGRAFLFGVVPFLVLLAAATAKWFGHDALPDRETIWFQATMPGFAEELSFRGLLLALFDRLFAARFKLGGAEIGYGAFATSVIFGIGHGIALDHALALHWDIVNGLSAAAIGLFLAWLRLRTKSLVLPIVVHNAINLIFFCVPRLG